MPRQAPKAAIAIIIAVEAADVVLLGLAGNFAASDPHRWPTWLAFMPATPQLTVYVTAVAAVVLPVVGFFLAQIAPHPSEVDSPAVVDSTTPTSTNLHADPTVLPIRNLKFVGRQRLLAQLEAGLTGPGRNAVVLHALHGTGGVGKTDLAIEYAHQHHADYDLTVWIDAEQPALIPDQLAQLAPKLGVAETPDTNATSKAVLSTLSRHHNWLLIFDNAQQPDHIRPYLPNGDGHVLITSRQTGWTNIAQPLDVDVLTDTEAIDLLRKLAPITPIDTAAKIAAALGNLPLALAQAGAYLDQTGLPAEQYLQLLTTRAGQLLDKGHIPGAQHTIATVWDISHQHLTKTSPPAVQLLNLCAFLGPEPLPLDLFTNNPNQLPQPLAEVAAEPDRWADTVGALVGYSLARRDQNTITIHRLLATVLRHQQPEPDHTRNLTTVLNLCRADLPADIDDTPESWPRWRQLLPHVLAATNHVPEPAPTDLAQDTSWLLDRAGAYLQTTAQLDTARTMFERALRISEAAYGPDHPTVATRVNNLAMVLQELGQLDAARTMLERALRISEAAYGPDHPTVATGVNNLATVLQELGQLDAARTMLERALRIDEATYGPDHPTVATRVNNLATVLQELGQLDAARTMLEQALRISEATYGPDHPTVATGVNNLATVLKDLGQLDAARTMLEQALRIDEATYGPDHPTVATRVNNLATVLKDLGQLDAARTMLEQALRIDEATYGPDHPTVATGVNNLAMVLKDLGQLDAARTMLEQALRIDEATYGPDHPTVARDVNNLAMVLKDLGQLDAARTMFEQALRIYEATYGPDHPNVATGVNNLALVLQDLGQLDAARTMFERALRIYEAAYGPDQPTTKSVRDNLAQLGQHLPSQRSNEPTPYGTEVQQPTPPALVVDTPQTISELGKP